MSPSNRPRDPPWPIRRAPAIAVSVITLSVGVGLVMISASINQRHSWAASLLVNMGTAVLLLVPLLGLAQLFEWRLLRAETRVSARVQNLSAEIDNVRQQVADALGQLSMDTVQRLADEHASGRAQIDEIRQNPSRISIAKALQSAGDMRLVNRRGPRVSISGTPFYVRWELAGDCQNTDPGDVLITIEESGGSGITKCTWSNAETALDLSVRIGKLLREMHHYPGDAAYQPGLMFDELYRLMDLGYRHATGEDVMSHRLSPIIQLVGKQWVITDQDIVTSDNCGQYSIIMHRLDELDWDEHMRGKPWVKIDEFRRAIDTARDLIASGIISTTLPEPATQ